MKRDNGVDRTLILSFSLSGVLLRSLGIFALHVQKQFTAFSHLEWQFNNGLTALPNLLLYDKSPISQEFNDNVY